MTYFVTIERDAYPDVEIEGADYLTIDTDDGFLVVVCSDGRQYGFALSQVVGYDQVPEKVPGQVFTTTEDAEAVPMDTKLRDSVGDVFVRVEGGFVYHIIAGRELVSKDQYVWDGDRTGDYAPYTVIED